MTKEKKIKAQKLKGFQDFEPLLMKKKLEFLHLAQNLSALAGYEPIDTPSLEYTETILGEGGETDKQVFRFKDNGDRDVALRFDLTMSFARYISENQGTLIFPFKRFQYGKAWRAEKPQKGRFREFTQCDLDIIGAAPYSGEIDLISTFMNILDQILKEDFTVFVNHRRLISSLIKKTFQGISESDEQTILINLDKLDKIGSESVIRLLSDKFSFDTSSSRTLVDLIVNSKEDNLKAVADYLKGHETGIKDLEDLKETVRIIENSCLSKFGKIKIDLSTVRGLGYYTGMIFETTIDHHQDFGAICSGGRYDNLAERFLSRQLSGVGGSIGIDRILAAKVERLNNHETPSTDAVFIAVAEEKTRPYAFKILEHLRKHKIIANIDLKHQKLAQQFKWANRAGYKKVITIGESERQTGLLNVKYMETGQQKKDIAIADLVNELL